MKRFVNQIGMVMLPVDPDCFQMGGGCLTADHHALPIHTVTLSKGFFIAQQPVTVAQYEAFLRDVKVDYGGYQERWGFVTGVSHEGASAFARWLTLTLGASYSLPTEAQWEYVARNIPSIPADRMGDALLREWCFDWYAPYDDQESVDPAGPVNGMFKVVRGGYMDSPKRYNAYPRAPYFRAAMPPRYTSYSLDKHNTFGQHPIGFRVVMGEAPKPFGRQLPFFSSVAVKQLTAMHAQHGPPESAPYFRKRHLFPIPPDNCSQREIRLAGFPPGFRHHHHSPGFTAAPNGDLLYTAYSTYHEYDAEAGLVACRLRLGSDEWCMPGTYIDTVGVNDHAPLLHTGRDDRIHLFWGWPQLDHAYPFQHTHSDDNGETWQDVGFPLFTELAEHVDPQPVNSCVEAKDGTFYLVSDASFGVSELAERHHLGGASSVLWRSKDQMCTWQNPKARTAGRHSTAVQLLDGRILTLGGKNSDIDGYMPAAITEDGGDSYAVTQTVLPAMGSGQRPSILRLASGALVVCGDYQTKGNKKPLLHSDRAGSFVALSDDEGKTWSFRQLWGTQVRKKGTGEFGNASTIGYSVMKQSADGLIHVVCTNVHPQLHLCFNEAWLRSPQLQEPDEISLMQSTATRLLTKRRAYEEHYPDGKLKCRYQGGVADDGRFLLDGREEFYYPNGTLMWEASYRLGQRVGMFAYYDFDGNPVRRHEYHTTDDGFVQELVETFWSKCDKVRTRTSFVDRVAQGEAFYFDRNGCVLDKGFFIDGKLEQGFDNLEL